MCAAQIGKGLVRVPFASFLYLRANSRKRVNNDDNSLNNDIYMVIIELRKETYVSPWIVVVKTESACQLLNGSKLNGRHNQGHVGGGGGDAKQGLFDESELEDDTIENNPITFTQWDE